VHLTPHDQERLLVSYAAKLALRRRARAGRPGLRPDRHVDVVFVRRWLGRPVSKQ
jgi:urease gamma subunit